MIFGKRRESEPPVAAVGGAPASETPEEARLRGEVTELLQQVVDGRPSAAEVLMPLIYEELRKIARSFMRRERPDHTLQPTALVHEAYLRMLGQNQVSWEGRGHFFSMAATMMRRILVDSSRRQLRQKRGGGVDHQELTDRQLAAPGDGIQALDVLALHEALERLAERDRRMVQIVELRFFAGLGIEDIATVLGISEPTVKRSWTVARAWLARDLGAQ